MSYATTADMMQRYPNRDLVQLTSEDPTSETVDTRYLQTFLSDASAEIDAYLESRFKLPLLNIPAILTRMCCEIAMYHLQNLRPIHDLEFAKTIYNGNIAQLKEVREGKLTLGLSPMNIEPDAPTNPAVVFVQAGGNTPGASIVPQRVFSRSKLIGF